MCRFQSWEDELPESEVYGQRFEEGRYGETDLVEQLQECMNQMTAIIESMKEINARLKNMNYFLSAFLFLICIIEVFKYLRGKS